jgi:hypothetical protein
VRELTISALGIQPVLVFAPK